MLFFYLHRLGKLNEKLLFSIKRSSGEVKNNTITRMKFKDVNWVYKKENICLKNLLLPNREEFLNIVIKPDNEAELTYQNYLAHYAHVVDKVF